MTTSQTSKMGQQFVLPTATSRPVVNATEGVISSGHHLTSMAGMRILLGGGNAFDAIAAASFAAAVVEPTAAYSLACEGVFMLYHAGSGDILSLSGQGVAPGRATVEFYQSLGLDAIPTGPGPQAHLAFTVPGIVDALISLLERYGTITLKEAMAPAIHYAEHGFPNYAHIISRTDQPQTREQFDIYPPGGKEVFYENGNSPDVGSILVQKSLARTLKKMEMAERDASGDRIAGLRAARDIFYRGEIAQNMVEAAQRVGGILSMEDLALYRSQFHEPLKTTFMDHEIYGHSTWTQGPVLMQALNILEHFDLKKMGHNTAKYIHTVTESLKLAMADRQAYYGDPDFANIPIEGLLSKKYAAHRADLIDPKKAYPEIPPAGDPWQDSKGISSNPSTNDSACQVSDGLSGNEKDTTHIAAIDQDGNMVCATPSGGPLQSSVFFPELGCTLSVRMEMFNFEENHPNVLVPGKRPRTTLVNYIVCEKGQPLMTIGCPGGDMQAQASVQLILNTLVFGMNPQEAVEAPRFGTLSVANSFFPHVYYPGRLAVEKGVSDVVVESLEELGHSVVRSEGCGAGATVARRDPEKGVLGASGDPRTESYAIGW